jgi:hypothetical protein
VQTAVLDSSSIPPVAIRVPLKLLSLPDLIQELEEQHLEDH